MSKENRNEYIDAFRGIAMLMVVMQHTICGCTVDYENSMLLNMLWTIQMPLFVIISGYVTIYSRKIETIGELLNFVCRRSFTYLIPWLSWTFLIRGGILGQIRFFNVKNLLWHMDTGYWFLLTIWTISMIFGIAQYLSAKIHKNKSWIKGIVSTIVFMIIGTVLLLSIGLLFGMSFLGIKLTIYYIPFFCAGYLFSVLQAQYRECSWFKDICRVIIAGSALIYVSLIIRVNFYTIGDSLNEVMLRIFASLTGCISLFGLAGGLPILRKEIQWIGKNSLNIYLCHYVFLSLLNTEKQVLVSYNGIISLMINYLITIGLTVLVVQLIQRNSILNKVLFGK